MPALHKRESLRGGGRPATDTKRQGEGVCIFTDQISCWRGPKVTQIANLTLLLALPPPSAPAREGLISVIIN